MTSLEEVMDAALRLSVAEQRTLQERLHEAEELRALRALSDELAAESDQVDDATLAAEIRQLKADMPCPRP
ncbi:MAG: hypothetical protein HUU35_15570 [Armatimonadetes bacterium]|nr:hypothetical protein [Armatimonadota bacterium]